MSVLGFPGCSHIARSQACKRYTVCTQIVRKTCRVVNVLHPSPNSRGFCGGAVLFMRAWQISKWAHPFQRCRRTRRQRFSLISVISGGYDPMTQTIIVSGGTTLARTYQGITSLYDVTATVIAWPVASVAKSGTLNQSQHYLICFNNASRIVCSEADCVQSACQRIFWLSCIGVGRGPASLCASIALQPMQG
eukprot:1048408-Amphidinium_carterae.3